MENGKFTREEREHLLSLEAVEKVTSTQIIYNKQFKEECMRRYRAGERPGAIFASAGLPSSLIGYKRIERAIYHWKEAEAKDALTSTDAPSIKRAKHVESLKREKREAVARQRAIREKHISEMEDKLAKQKARSEKEKERIIASQAAEIAALKAQVKALKALGTLARRTQRAPQTTKKSERFELIFQLKSEDTDFNISAACEALEVSRRGYYDWIASAPKRAEREKADLVTYSQVKKAFEYKRTIKGSRQVVDCLRRTQEITMNRKKVQRIMRKFDLVCKKKKKNPYHPIGADGLPKVADNTVNRDFRRRAARQVISTDITYLPNVNGFSYLSGVIDCETNELIAHVTSDSMEEEFVIKTQKQLEGQIIPGVTWECSDQGVHYTAQAYREILGKLGINQSMSRKACCWDNAPIESFWGTMKDQIGSTENMTHEEIVNLVDNYIDYYNNERGQARLGWLTPTESAALQSEEHPSPPCFSGGTAPHCRALRSEARPDRDIEDAARFRRWKSILRCIRL